MVDYNSIEKKWLDEWEKAKLNEKDVEEKEGILVTAAFPYVDMPQHIGHLRTYGTADFYSRYKRMRGFNVLYPMGFHKTGTPILAISKKVASNDPKIKDDLKNYGISDEDIKKMSDPYFMADYFARVTEIGMRRAGYSIDWTRKFDSINPIFSKMVEWQFNVLNNKHELVTGEHPVGWCPNEGNAVGQHDTKGDVQPELSELTAIKFKDSDSDAYFICATYRPETLYGVSNLFVNENEDYSLVELDGIKGYISSKSVPLLSDEYSIKVISNMKGSELLSKKAINPINGKVVPILNGFFVKPDFATGVVMSVPAHAPFDYMALKKLSDSGKTDIKENEYIKCIDSENNDPIPSLRYLKNIDQSLNLNSEQIEMATKEIYRTELRKGVMAVGDYIGKGVNEARELIKQDLINKNDAFKIYIISNKEPVYCRCGARVIVNLVEGQWFINYGDKDWKKTVNSYLPEISIYPKKDINAFQAASDWIDLRATERAQGLGTKFPLNPEHIVESLSDSTIYPMLYTFYNILDNYKIKPEQLTIDFFDYVVYGKLNIEDVSKSTGIEYKVLKRCRDSFTYWYRFTSRHSGSDLIFNHLTMYIYNHVMVFPEEFWPKQIVTNGLVNYEGVKMSKSLGNIVPLIDGIDKYGADTLRFIEIVSADLDKTAEFSVDSVNSIHQKMDYIFNLVDRIGSMKSEELSKIDFWLYSKLNRKIRDATEKVENFDLRNAYISIFYDSLNELRYYFERGGNNEIVISDFLTKMILMISPVMPFSAEELWHRLGNNSFISKEEWPICDESLIDDSIELLESVINSSIEDTAKAIELTSKMDENKGKNVKSVEFIIADQWKYDAYRDLRNSGNMSKVINDDKFKEIDKTKISKYLMPLMKTVKSLNDIPYNSKDEFETFDTSIEFISKKLGFDVSVKHEKDSDSDRAFRSYPGKPSIIVRWN